MRCISPHPRYSIQVIEADEQIVVDQRGQAHSLVLSKPVIADFEQGGLTEWEIEAALTKFNFSGVAEGVNVLTRISVFDTEAYVERFEDEEQKKSMLDKIDARLRKLQERNVSEFIIVEKPASAKPWPSYDEDSVEDILALRERIGLDPQTIRLYEVENGKRAAVIAAMEALESGEDVPFQQQTIEDVISVHA